MFMIFVAVFLFIICMSIIFVSYFLHLFYNQITTLLSRHRLLARASMHSDHSIPQLVSEAKILILLVDRWPSPSSNNTWRRCARGCCTALPGRNASWLARCSRTTTPIWPRKRWLWSSSSHHGVNDVKWCECVCLMHSGMVIDHVAFKCDTFCKIKRAARQALKQWVEAEDESSCVINSILFFRVFLPSCSLRRQKHNWLGDWLTKPLGTPLGQCLGLEWQRRSRPMRSSS